ncbi:MAG: hypothetical protein KGH75_02775 [Rhodospirillales bacterium]|nr:hypothetical protein [Rhodospirillales bacterium]
MRRSKPVPLPQPPCQDSLVPAGEPNAADRPGTMDDVTIKRKTFAQALARHLARELFAEAMVQR